MNFAKLPVLSDALKTALGSGLSLPSALNAAATAGLSPLHAWSGVSSAIAFIDGSVADYQTLVAGIAPGTEVHVLDSSQDAVTQITNTLLGRHNISSLHIVSHGEAGGLDFGTGKLNLKDLPEYAAQLQSWSKALTDDADLLLYGCNVAQGELGKAFTSILSQLTGADVAASDDLTGSASNGGNWTLEYQTGGIEAGLAISKGTRTNYQGTLAAGDPLWAKGFGSTGSDIGRAIAVDSSGNTYFTGQFSGSNVAFGSTTLSSNGGSTDIVVGKLDSTGNVLWAKSFGGTNADIGLGISVDSSGNPILTGQFAGSNVAFGSTTLASTGGSTDIVAVKLNGSDGNVLWAKGFGGTSTDFGNGISVDSSGNPILTGSFAGSNVAFGSTTLSSNGNQDIVAVKLNGSDGSVTWAKSFGGTVNDLGYGISVDSSGNPILTGYFSGSNVAFGNTTLASTGGSNDIVAVKLNGSDGSVTWAKSFGGTLNDLGYGVSVDSSGNPILTGTFAGTNVAFGSTTLATTGGSNDIVAVKLNGSDGSVTWAKGFGGTSTDIGYGISVDSSGNPILIGQFTNSSVVFGSTTLANNGSQDIVITKLSGLSAPTVSLSTTTPNLTEGGTPGSVTLNLSAAAASALTVNFTLTGAAGKDTDYTITPGAGISNFDPVAGTFTIDAGVTSASFTIQTIDDIAAEAAEGILLTLTGVDGGYSLGTASSTITIDQNDFGVVNTNDSGEGSLRQAVLNANALAGADTITFAGSTFTDTTPDTITLTSSELGISSDLTLQGTGANLLTISGNNASRVFNIGAGATVTLNGLTLTRGSSGAGFGGGISNSGTLTLSNSTLSSSTAAKGGGIWNNGTLTVNNSTLSSNTAANGGGIWNEGSTLTLNSSTLSGNTAGNTTTGAGGGITINGGTVTLNSSTLSGNRAGDFGGGIDANGNLTVSNSTFSGNTATNNGGALWNFNTLALSNSTFSGNTAANGGGLYNNTNGTITSLSNSTFSGNTTGIFNAGAITTITNSTLAGNVNAGIANNGTIANLYNNLFVSNGTNTVSGTITNQGNNLFGTFATLGVDSTLRNNGGLTQTHALLPGSSAINAAGANATTADQRGITAVGTRDIGAFESRGFTIAVTGGNNQSTLVNTAFTNPLAVTVSSAFNEPVAGGKITYFPNGSESINTADASFTGSPATIDASGNASATATANGIAGSYTVTAGGTGIATPATFSLTNLPPNAPPTSADKAVTFNEDAVYTFSQADFAFADTDGGTFTSVKITQLPGVGQLFLDNNSDNLQGTGEAIATNQVIAVADLGKLKFKPAADANGTNYASFQFQVNDGTSFSTSYIATLNVNAVNDAPSFTKGGDRTITAGASAQTIPNWATGFNPGPANESNQTVQAYEIVGNDHPEIFAVAPAIDPFGNLTYTPAPNVANTTTATISVQVRDSGGTANGGIDTSPAQTFAITVKPQPTISITPVSQNEGNSGTTVYTFTVSLSDTSTQTVSVNYATADSTATLADGDYSSASGTLTFAPGDTSKTFTVNVSGDAKYENTEAFLVNLSNAVNGAIATGSTSVNGTITNDDSVPTVNITPTLNQAEGNSGTNPYTFTVTLSNPSDQAIALNYNTVDGTATTADSDYTAATGTVTFAPGDISKTITVNATGDTKFETDETFQVALSAVVGTGAVTPGTTTSTATIANDDVLPTISIGNVSQNEGNNGTTAYTFAVNLSNASAQTVAVNYATADVTATVTDSDYVAANGSLSFAPGETSKTITVLVNGDTKFEVDQAFSVGLSNASNGTLGTSTGTGTVVNDDARPTISINNVSQNEGRTGTTPYTFTVSLSNTSDEIVTVNYATADRTATVADGDYTAAANTLTFNAGETTKTLTVLANGDTRAEPDETFVVTLTAPANATIATATGTGTIVNDDRANLIWRNGTTGTAPTGTGENLIWQMNGFTYQSAYYLPSVPDLNWQIVSRADFNSDGQTDLLWHQRATGENAIWTLNNFTLQSAYLIPTAGGLDWQIASTADFNHDSKPDILWRNQRTGENAIWQLNGAALQSGYFIASTDVNWQIADTADFNNDGTADILWRNRVTGENAIWQMNNFGLQTAYLILKITDQNWQIAGTSDFNRDGIADIVWHNKDTGTNAIWQMNSTGLQSGYTIRTAANINWQIAGIADFNGDSTPDLLWRNVQSNQEEIWQMSGFSYSQTYQLPGVSREWTVKTLPPA